MFGRWITGLIVVALAVGVWVLWPRGDTNSTTTTSSVQAAPTTTSEPTTTTLAATTTTGPVASPDVIETVEEAEEVLRELWFGWFEGIYNEDEDRIKEVVASQTQFDAAVAQFGVMEFAATPEPSSFAFQETEILRADTDCLAIWSNVQVDGFSDLPFSGVHVFRLMTGEWKLLSIWEYVDDLWEQECDAAFG
ncbi:hypothetical protein BH23ACT4_BH23ACT4_15560 [soil metagenome]